MSVHFIQPKFVDGVWHKAEPIVINACKRVMCGFTPEDIKQEIISGKRQLWISDKGDDYAVCITHIVNNPTHNTGVMAIGGGSHIGMTEDFFERLEEFFKNNDCKEMEMIGSIGWGRFMNRFGFKQKYIATARKL